MKTIYFVSFCLILCCACSRGKYYISDVFRNGNTENMQVLNLDKSYQFYLRQVYRDKNQRQENILKTNLEKNDTADKTRIEVEYLLLSWEQKKAIYISTIPDKYQHYYSSNHFADTLINAYDFSTFHFGIIHDDGESLSFTSKDRKKVMTWDIRPFINGSFPQKILIREIAIQRKDMLENVILINKALEEPLSFVRQKSFTIIFEKPGNRSDTCRDAAMLCCLSDQKIYLDPGSKGVDILFRFNKSISDSKDSAIRFDYRRTRYAPVQK